MKNILILLFFLTSCQSAQIETNTTQEIPIKEPTSIETQQNQLEIEQSISEPAELNIQNLQIQTWIDWLDTPWGLTFLDQNTAFVTQRNGTILKISNWQTQKEPYFQVSSNEIGEWWLMWIEKDPDFEENKYIYIMYTYSENRVLKNKIVRLIDTGKTLTEDKIILDNIPWNRYHNGGRIKFWPDKKLYITTWDASIPNNAQSFWNLAWKILRVNNDGSIPEDNPFPNSRIFAYWLRNPQWIAFDPNSWDLFTSSHGPTGEFGLMNRDRVLDFIIPGWNYGWPKVTWYSDTYQNPLIYSENTSIPPAGMTFWHDKVFITTLKSEKIIVATLEKQNNTWKVLHQEDFLTKEYGRLRDAIVWPDNNLYILTSNKDGRWNEKYGSDKILKISLQ